jgi:hypothetical protein
MFFQIPMINCTVQFGTRARLVPNPICQLLVSFSSSLTYPKFLKCRPVGILFKIYYLLKHIRRFYPFKVVKLRMVMGIEPDFRVSRQKFGKQIPVELTFVNLPVFSMRTAGIIIAVPIIGHLKHRHRIGTNLFPQFTSGLIDEFPSRVDSSLRELPAMLVVDSIDTMTNKNTAIGTSGKNYADPMAVVFQIHSDAQWKYAS